MRRILLILIALLLAAPSYAQDHKFVYFKKKAAVAGGGTSLFAEDFESNNWDAWTTSPSAGNLNIASDQANGGTYSVKWSNDNAADLRYGVETLAAGSQAKLWVNFYVRFNEVAVTGEGSSDYIILVYGMPGPVFQVGFELDATADPKDITKLKIRYMNAAGGSTSLTGTITVAAGTWYQVKARWEWVADGSCIIQGWFGGSLVIDQQTLTFNATNTTINQVRLGAMTDYWDVWTTLDIWVDDFGVADGDIW